MTKSSNQQLQWVNIVKGITISVVVFLHINYSGYDAEHYYQIKNIIGDAWDMPVFFMIGGFFLSRKKLHSPLNFLRRKFNTLYIRLLIYYLAFLLIHNMLIDTGFLSTSMEYGGKQMIMFGGADLLKKVAMAVCFMGREPYLAPLWFIYVMSMAFIIIAILSRLAERLSGGSGNRWHAIMTVTLSASCALSLYFTNSLGINIPRCNNVFSAAWLIYAGYMVRNILQLDFSNKLAAAISLFSLVALCLANEHMALITNSYPDIIIMTLTGLSALSILSFLSQKMEGTLIGGCVAKIGEYSYHIMALHILFMNIFACILNSIFRTSYPIDKLGSETSSLTETMMFCGIGIALPMMFIALLSHSYKFLICKRKQS